MCEFDTTKTRWDYIDEIRDIPCVLIKRVDVEIYEKVPNDDLILEKYNEIVSRDKKYNFLEIIRGIIHYFYWSTIGHIHNPEYSNKIRLIHNIIKNKI